MMKTRSILIMAAAVSVVVSLGWTAVSALCWTTHLYCSDGTGYDLTGMPYVIHMFGHHPWEFVRDCFRGVIIPVFPWLFAVSCALGFSVRWIVKKKATRPQHGVGRYSDGRADAPTGARQP